MVHVVRHPLHLLNPIKTNQFQHVAVTAAVGMDLVIVDIALAAVAAAASTVTAMSQIAVAVVHQLKQKRVKLIDKTIAITALLAAQHPTSNHKDILIHRLTR